jgi:GT2 family glycosyltransferase
MSLRIGVVTVLYNSSSVLPGFFASLGPQTLQDFHVWAVDNASTDNSVAQCHAYADRITVIANETNRGVAAGNNQGIVAALEAGCDTILLLNNDVEFGAELFAELYDGLAANQCQITAPIMYYFDRPDVVWSAGGKFQPLLGYRCNLLEDGTRDVGQFTKPTRIEHAPTCCVLFRRSVFAKVGLMDERYFVYHDDTDFMLRCLKLGESMFLLPHAHLLHKVSSLTGGSESEFSIRMGTRNRIFMLTKFMGRLVGFPYVVAIAFSYLLLRLAGRLSATKFALKQRSLRQGFLMATNWFPYQPALNSQSRIS